MAPRIEPETLDAARRRDPNAVGTIYDAFSNAIFRYVRLQVQNTEDAEDITDQVFLRMLEALPRYQERGIPFAAWLYRIAGNLVVDHARKHTRRRALHADLHDSVPARGFGADTAVEATAWCVENEVLDSALARLPVDQRKYIVLRYVEGWETHEIAAAMGRRLNTIYSLKHRAFAALRRALEEAPPVGAEPERGDIVIDGELYVGGEGFVDGELALSAMPLEAARVAGNGVPDAVEPAYAHGELRGNAELVRYGEESHDAAPVGPITESGGGRTAQ